MKYKNAAEVFPKELVQLLQQYVQGQYVYIPAVQKSPRHSTAYRMELQKRNAHIYTGSLEGISHRRLAQLYHLSEPSIRRILIQKRKEAHTMQQTIQSILPLWDLPDVPLHQLYDTVWQVGDSYVIKAYTDLSALERNLTLTRILDSMGIPVGAPLPTREDQPYAVYGEHYFLVSRRLPGRKLLQVGVSEARCMGQVLARLHLAFRQCEQAAEFWNNSLLSEMEGWVRSSFAQNGWRAIPQVQFDTLTARLSEIYGDLPVQLIHRDVHFGNFLFDGETFSGYIDFDLSQRNIRIFDLCYFLLGLLSEEEKLSVTRKQWFSLVSAVFQGYESLLPLTAQEKAAVPCVMACIELLFAAYFESVHDTVCAENVIGLYQFVTAQEQNILRSIG